MDWGHDHINEEQGICPHEHDWETCGWGVIIGVSKCKRCGKTSSTKDFPTYSLREQASSENRTSEDI